MWINSRLFQGPSSDVRRSQTTGHRRRQRTAKTRSISAVIEQLEQRSLLATLTVVGGGVTVITCVGGNTKINGTDPDTGVMHCDQLTAVLIKGGPLGDLFDLSAIGAEFTMVTSVRVEGLDGNDTILGTGIGDELLGGLGDDSIDGGAGDDTISGYE